MEIRKAMTAADGFFYRERAVTFERLLKEVCYNVHPELISRIKKEIGYGESDSVGSTEDGDEGPRVA